MIRVLLLAVSVSTLTGCAALFEALAPEAPTFITGTVRSVAGEPLPGMVLLEKGELHGNVWDRGALVDRAGNFRIEVRRGGQYGLHLYSSGYFYRPQAILVKTGETLHLELKLAPQPTRDPDPVIRRLEFAPAADGRALIRMEVADPDDNLGPQVMAFDAGAGRAYAMTPPVPVKDLKANFPQGVYTLEADVRGRQLEPRDWHFVVADHACWTSDIFSFPHDPQPPRVVR